jgi:hypothetical protein
MITIDQLNQKYRTKDDPWDFSLFKAWLKKKGIDEPVIEATLKKALIDWDINSIPDNHDLFDNLMLLKALLTKEEIEKDYHKKLQESVLEAVNKSDTDWYSLTKLKRIWLVLTGKD